jgi:hypothetical protein
MRPSSLLATSNKELIMIKQIFPALALALLLCPSSALAKENPIRCKFYRFTCGRDKRLKEIWGEDAGR